MHKIGEMPELFEDETFSDNKISRGAVLNGAYGTTVCRFCSCYMYKLDLALMDLPGNVSYCSDVISRKRDLESERGQDVS